MSVFIPTRTGRIRPEVSTFLSYLSLLRLLEEMTEDAAGYLPFSTYHQIDLAMKALETAELRALLSSH